MGIDMASLTTIDRITAITIIMTIIVVMVGQPTIAISQGLYNQPLPLTNR